MHFLYAVCRKLSGKGKKGQQIKGKTGVTENEKSLCRQKIQSVILIIKNEIRTVMVEMDVLSRKYHDFFLSLWKNKLAKISRICYFIRACQLFNKEKWRKTGYVEKENK